MVKNILTHNLSEPLDAARTARIEIDPGDGNLMVDSLTGGEHLLTTGELQYLQGKALPTRSIEVSNGQTILSLRAAGGGQPWFRLPWSACNGATTWQVHLNPTVAAEINAHSAGGNIHLNLAGMAVLTHVATETGGGNVEVVLPAGAADLSLSARTGGGNLSIAIGQGLRGVNTIAASSGAGNLLINLPDGLAARILATSGLGKVILDPRFTRISDNLYQSNGYETAVDKVEITARTGAGNVTVSAG